MHYKLLFAFLTSTLFVQAQTADDIVRDIASLLRDDNNCYVMQKVSNTGRGITNYTNMQFYGATGLWVAGPGGVASWTPEMLAKLDSTNAANAVKDKLLLEQIVQKLDQLSGMARDVYHHESHSGGIDTIQYSMDLYTGTASHNVRSWRSRTTGMTFYGPPHYLSCEYYADTTQHRMNLQYTHEPNVKAEVIPFRQKDFMKLLKPVLKEKSLSRHKIQMEWGQGFKSEKEADLSKYYLVSQVTTESGTTFSGTAEGTVYSFPKGDADLQLRVLDAVRDIIRDYTSAHSEQWYEYVVNDHRINTGYSNILLARIVGYDEEDQSRSDEFTYFTIFSVWEEGTLHLILLNYRGALWVPHGISQMTHFVGEKNASAEQ